MEPAYGSDRSQLIEAFLIDELSIRIQQVTMLRRLERQSGGLMVEEMETLLTVQSEAQDIAAALWHWRGDPEREFPTTRAYRRLLAAVLLLRFTVMPQKKVSWPPSLRMFFDDIDLLRLLPHLFGNAVSRWYRGLVPQSALLPKGEEAAWLRESCAGIILAYEDLVRGVPDTDRPPP